MKDARKRGWIGYTLFCVLLLVVLLVVRFPEEDIKGALMAVAAEHDPPLHLSVENVRPAFPPALRCSGVRLSLDQERDRPLFEAALVLVRPVLWTLVKGPLACDFHGLGYGGEMAGYIRMPSKGGENGITGNLNLQSLDLGQHAWMSERVQSGTMGVLDGRMEYEGDLERWWTGGKGEAHLTLSSGTVRLARPFLGMEAFPYEEAVLDVTLENNRLELKDLRWKGGAFQGQLSGAITLHSILVQSTLDLKGSLEGTGGAFPGQKPSGLGALIGQAIQSLKQSFVIRGTLQSPDIRLLNQGVTDRGKAG